MSSGCKAALLAFGIGKQRSGKRQRAGIDPLLMSLFQLPPVGERLRAAHGVGDDGGVLD